MSILKNVLITGANSYIGTSLEKWISDKYSTEISISTLDMLNSDWREKDFLKYDCIFHVAGIAHVDVGNATEESKNKYYSVNCDLAVETAKKAKAEGVKQFIFMSSAIVYGDSAPFGKRKVIKADTEPSPVNFYGDSKFQADMKLRKLETDYFKIAVLRPPMIYGKGSKGNYPLLTKMAKHLPIFPNVENERSMLYIDNLCEFLCQIILNEERGLFFPQNAEYVKTSDMVKLIAEVSGHRIRVGREWNWMVMLASHIPGKVGKLTNKAFGNLVYDQSMSTYDFEYRVADFRESIEKSEKE